MIYDYVSAEVSAQNAENAEIADIDVKKMRNRNSKTLSSALPALPWHYVWVIG
ncbi:MAG: hypothetical protein ACE5KZ_08925 [Candidatus Scalinduaceae bacterium]